MAISIENQYSSSHYSSYEKVLKHLKENKNERKEVTYNIHTQSIEYSSSYQKDQAKTIFTHFDLASIPKEQIEKLEKIGKLSSINSYTYMRDFQETLASPEIKDLFKDDNGIKNNSFDKYANKMALAYDKMLSKIEDKYNSPDRETEYFLAEGGEIQELTKEKEIDMLNKSYERHSTFMASSMAIWKGLQDFNVNIEHYPAGEKQISGSYYESSASVMLSKNSSSGNRYIAKWAYSAFMSAIRTDNLDIIHNMHGYADNINLDLGLSDQQRHELNIMLDRWYSNIPKR